MKCVTLATCYTLKTNHYRVGLHRKQSFAGAIKQVGVYFQELGIVGSHQKKKSMKKDPAKPYGQLHVGKGYFKFYYLVKCNY